MPNGDIYEGDFQDGFGLKFISLYRNVESTRCLNVNKNKLKATETCNGSNNQKWVYFDQQMINFDTKECLDSNENGFTFLTSCKDIKSQKWETIAIVRNEIFIKNIATNKVLESNFNGDVFTVPLTESKNYQRWEKIVNF